MPTPGFRSPPQTKNSRREWERRAIAQNKINVDLEKENVELENKMRAMLADIRAALEACESYISWPMVPRKVKAILIKYRTN